MKQKFFLTATVVALFFIACNKVANEKPVFTDTQVESRQKLNLGEATIAFPISNGNYYYWDPINFVQHVFCSGPGHYCSPTTWVGSAWFDYPAGALAWPLIAQTEGSGMMVDLQWETDSSLKLRFLSEFPSYEQVLEDAGGNEDAAKLAYDLMRERLELASQVILDGAICEMLFESYNGEKLVLLPGEYPIQYSGDSSPEVIIPVEIY